jgi:excisionase family DNA binding protein
METYQMVPRLLTKDEACDLLRISPRSIDRLRSDGKLRALKLGDRVLFSPDELQRLLDAQREGGR